MFSKRNENAFQDTIQVLIDIRIVATKHTVADRLNIFGSLLIIFDLLVVTMGDAVDFNHQTRFIADEINDIISKGNLPIEFPTLQSLGS